MTTTKIFLFLQKVNFKEIFNNLWQVQKLGNSSKYKQMKTKFKPRPVHTSFIFGENTLNHETTVNEFMEKRNIIYQGKKSCCKNCIYWSLINRNQLDYVWGVNLNYLDFFTWISRKKTVQLSWIFYSVKYVEMNWFRRVTCLQISRISCFHQT